MFNTTGVKGSRSEINLAHTLYKLKKMGQTHQWANSNFLCTCDMKTIYLSTQTISANILKCPYDASFKPKEELHNVLVITENKFLVNVVVIFYIQLILVKCRRGLRSKSHGQKQTKRQKVTCYVAL